MKKIVTFILGFSSSTLALAAQVSIEHIVDGIGTRQLFSTHGETYILGGADDPEPVYLNQALPGKDTSVNNGSELIYLGAHQSSAFGNNEIVVNIDNTAGGTTGSVSLVLSAAVDTTWNFDIESGISLENIFVIAQGSQTLKFGAIETVLGDTSSFQNDLVNVAQVPGNTSIFRSENSICGYALFDNDLSCNTDRVLGLPSRPISLGLDSNIPFRDHLAELQQEFSSLLQQQLVVSNFSGSYIVDQFNIEIDTAAVIPVPAAAWLFGSALLGLVVRKKQY